MNFPTAAGEVETHKFQLSIVYHLLLFSVGVRRLPRSRFLASVMLSKDSTRTELGKRPIPTRRVGHNLNTITYRRSLLSRQPNSYHRGYRKDKREDNLVSHSLLLFGYSGNNQVTSSPGWDRHRTTRPGPRCVPPFFLFHYPLMPRTRNCDFTSISEAAADGQIAYWENVFVDIWWAYYCISWGVKKFFDVFSGMQNSHFYALPLCVSLCNFFPVNVSLFSLYMRTSVFLVFYCLIIFCFVHYVFSGIVDYVFKFFLLDFANKALFPQ